MEDAGWLARGRAQHRIPQWIGGAALVAVVGLALREPLLVLLALAVAFALGLALLWRRYGLRHVRYTRAFSQARAFPGDEVTLEITIENAKPLPLPWLEARDEFPTALGFPGLPLEPSAKPKVSVFRSLLSVRPYERVRRRYRVQCAARGLHHFGPVTLKTGDVFGIATTTDDGVAIDDLLVYPRVVPVTDFGLPAKQPLGDARPVRPLLEDPLRFSGVRPYLPGDVPRRVHWRASARTGQLQSKQFEPSAAPTLAIFLDVNTFEHFWEGIDPRRLELAVSAAASIAAHGLDEGRQVGLYANAPLAGGERFVRLPPSRHPAQLTRVLEALALLVPYTGNRIEALIAGETRRLPWGATIVAISGYITAGLEDTLAGLHRAGHAITLIAADGAPDLPTLPGFAVYRLGEGAGRERDELAAFELA